VSNPFNFLYIPVEKTNELEKIGIKVKNIKNAGYFNAVSGYKDFLKLLKY